MATTPSVTRYFLRNSQLFGPALRVTVASIHTGTVVAHLLTSQSYWLYFFCCWPTQRISFFPAPDT
ncbi:uncharacterized protein SCHCODRAFT_02632457 [Schizophyllum commune H4-8]|uniref:uncharacterized protein n=1 Tax=Schizophyllum commune (strain H4-8 / FGSC 9210) TaxID=578458 RepID=UPI00215F36E4|nr:uncharacterized protein SCHCODRAFT_02632457 [Schizophyllum commune H4-8]KAI5890639.1 hypothetical protein SCHCODRAFT_02632457 [Schizophyllum commune H4-8]